MKVTVTTTFEVNCEPVLGNDGWLRLTPYGAFPGDNPDSIKSIAKDIFDDLVYEWDVDGLTPSGKERYLFIQNHVSNYDHEVEVSGQLNFTPEQDRLAVDALKMIRTVEETLHQARHEINMERPTTALHCLNEARHELTLARETVREITRIT